MGVSVNDTPTSSAPSMPCFASFDINDSAAKAHCVHAVARVYMPLASVILPKMSCCQTSFKKKAGKAGPFFMLKVSESAATDVVRSHLYCSDESYHVTSLRM